MRSGVITALGIVGLLLSLVAATFFNAAGLIWTGEGFDHALYWEPLESSITVFFGAVLLAGWLVTVVVIMVVSLTGVDSQQKTRVRRVGAAWATASTIVTAMFLIVALVVLPAQYEWVRY